ncbi:hypothetical protein GN244_ATG20568, partial [Phytophthora infestans]
GYITALPHLLYDKLLPYSRTAPVISGHPGHRATSKTTRSRDATNRSATWTNSSMRSHSRVKTSDSSSRRRAADVGEGSVEAADSDDTLASQDRVPEPPSKAGSADPDPRALPATTASTASTRRPIGD